MLGRGLFRRLLSSLICHPPCLHARDSTVEVDLQCADGLRPVRMAYVRARAARDRARMRKTKVVPQTSSFWPLSWFPMVSAIFYELSICLAMVGYYLYYHWHNSVLNALFHGSLSLTWFYGIVQSQKRV